MSSSLPWEGGRVTILVVNKTCVPAGRILTSLVGAVIAMTCLVPASAHGTPLECTPIHVVEAAGTDESHSWHPSAQPKLFHDGSSIALDLQNEYGSETVSVYNVRYPSTLGRFNPFTAKTISGSEDATYGESHAAGMRDALRDIETTAAHCPGTRFALIGYSQGAHIMGDVAADIAAGDLAGVSASDVVGVVLFADPGRSLTPESNAPEVTAANGEIVNGGGTPVLPGRVGLTGQRERPFTGLEGKVLSLCHADDLACSAPIHSVAHSVADYAARIEKDVPNAETGLKVRQLRNGDLPVSFSATDADALAAVGPEITGAVDAIQGHFAGDSASAAMQEAAWTARMVATFDVKHRSYWDWPYTGQFQINGQRGYDYAEQ